jgi:alpha-L-fucosidase
LLNIGPKGDGSIPQESIESMRAIGQWMATNGEAIYGTAASPFERPPWGRYTKKAGRLFVHVFECFLREKRNAASGDTKARLYPV